MRPALRRLSFYLAAFALLWSWSASATTIDPLLFEELVLGADFVGVIECEEAGGIVAAYRLIESLARRGHKDAVARGLEVFRELAPADRQSPGSMESVPHRNLQKRVLVLLSNSARAGGAPQPAPPGQAPSSFDSLVTWCKKHGDKLVLRDPWLGILEKQKID